MERHFHDSFFNVVRIDRRDRKKEKEIETERLERGQKNRNGSISFGESFSQEYEENFFCFIPLLPLLISVFGFISMSLSLSLFLRGEMVEKQETIWF